jgi:hypothetical protein
MLRLNPNSRGWRFWYGARSKSQVRLIRVKSHPRGATVGGKSSPTTEGYLKRPPQVGALDPQCFCVCMICSQVAEGSEGSPSRARVKEHRPRDLQRLKPKAMSRTCHRHRRSEATTLPRTHVGVSFHTQCNDYLIIDWITTLTAHSISGIGC